MASYHHLKLHTSSSSRMTKPFTACLYNLFKSYGEASKGSTSGHEHHMQEKAPSTAEIFKSMAEEKNKLKAEAEEGVASQTSEKASEEAKESVGDASGDQDIKNKFKEHEARADYHKKH